MKNSKLLVSLSKEKPLQRSLAILKSVTHRADGVGIAGVDAVEDVRGGAGFWAAAARRALLLLLVAGGGVVAESSLLLSSFKVKSMFISCTFDACILEWISSAK